MPLSKYNVAIILSFIIFAISSCGPTREEAGVPHFLVNLSSKTREIDAKLKNITGDKLSISVLDYLMRKDVGEEPNGPELYNPEKSIDNSKSFDITPTGSYISSISHHNNSSANIKEAASKLLQSINASPSCAKRCTRDFREAMKTKNNVMLKRLSEVTKSAIANEIANENDYLPLYHGFSNEWRLYQDILRVIKSFEYLEPLDTTFPLRDFAFNDDKIVLNNFLKDWWKEYLLFCKTKGVSPWAKEGRRAEGNIVGLSFFPDSITYARKYIISANVNLFGNGLSPANNTPFFFLNSAGASQLDIVDPLIKIALLPYLKDKNGNLDKDKFDKVLQDVKEIFDRYMADSGGQLAQIFVKKNIAPKVAFLAWNGGEPQWLSRSTGTLVFIRKNNTNFPPNVFWPIKKERYVMPDMVQTMHDFIFRPKELTTVMGMPISNMKNEMAREFVSERDVNEFVARDMLQARLLPNPEYFTDQNATGVRMFTFNDVKPDRVAAYNGEMFQVIREVMSNFLEHAQSKNDFKPGEYPLKRVFLEMKKNKSP